MKLPASERYADERAMRLRCIEVAIGACPNDLDRAVLIARRMMTFIEGEIENGGPSPLRVIATTGVIAKG